MPDAPVERSWEQMRTPDFGDRRHLCRLVLPLRGIHERMEKLEVGAIIYPSGSNRSTDQAPGRVSHSRRRGEEASRPDGQDGCICAGRPSKRAGIALQN